MLNSTETGPAPAPLFLCDWIEAVFIHFEVDPESLQRHTPYELHLYLDKAYVSLVAFTMRGLRPQFGGRLAAALVSPIATHRFFNVRTYVRHGARTGIFFIREWLDNRLSVMLGPATFGLPYHYGQLEYEHDRLNGEMQGRVRAGGAQVAYDAQIDFEEENTTEDEALSDFLLERYTAFTAAGMRKLFFRVWHAPWHRYRLNARLSEDSLLVNCFPWYRGAKLTAAHFSPGVANVGVSFPRRVKKLEAAGISSACSFGRAVATQSRRDACAVECRS